MEQATVASENGDLYAVTIRNASVHSGAITDIHQLDHTSDIITWDLAQNYPNPFNSSTAIEFRLPKTEHVEISIHNILGQKVKALFTGTYNAGSYQVIWDGTDESGLPVSSGLYVCRFRTKDCVLARTMILLK